jgi:hypothetical protein
MKDNCSDHTNRTAGRQNNRYCNSWTVTIDFFRTANTEHGIIANVGRSYALSNIRQGNILSRVWRMPENNHAKSKHELWEEFNRIFFNVSRTSKLILKFRRTFPCMLLSACVEACYKIRQYWPHKILRVLNNGLLLKLPCFLLRWVVEAQIPAITHMEMLSHLFTPDSDIVQEVGGVFSLNRVCFSLTINSKAKKNTK